MFRTISCLWLIPICLSPRLCFAEPGEGDAAVSAPPELYADQLPPISFPDPFPLSLLAPQFTADTAATQAAGSALFSPQFVWSNTVNRRGGSFLIDAETRALWLDGRYAPIDGLELNASLPLVWRGAGVLDDPIYEWHDLFELPQGPRDDSDLEDDQFEIFGRDPEGNRYELTKDGFGTGNAAAGLKYRLSGAGAPRIWSVLGKLTLPTARDEYGLDGVGIRTGVLYSQIGEVFRFHGGAHYIYLTENELNGFEFTRNRGAGTATVEAVFNRLSFQLGLTYGSKLIDNISRFPDYQVYLDLGGRWRFAPKAALEALIRENPGPGSGTADFSFLFGLNFTT